MVGGLIGALVLNFAYFLGVVLVGAAFGAMVATMLWGRAGAEPHVLVVILFAVVGAVGAMLLQRFVIIVGTAFGGAWTALVGGLALLGDRRRAGRGIGQQRLGRVPARSRAREAVGAVGHGWVLASPAP